MLLARSLGRLGFALPTFGMTCTELPVLVLDSAEVELTILVHSLNYFGFAASILGLGRLGLSISLLDAMHADLPMLLQSSGCLGSVMFTLDFLHTGLMLFVRAFVCFGSTPLLYNDLYFPTGWAGETLSVLGRARFGFLLSAPDLTHFGLLMLLRSVA
eukprot:s154_g9.t1